MNVVCLGAHPDDCEVFAGGTAVKWSRLGNRVLFVSMTNGDIGHHQMGGAALAKRRRAESQLSAQRGGVHELVLDYHDGELEPSLEVRKEVVRIIRRWEADVVLTHRPNDYHPDHRYTSVAVQDAAFMVIVPGFCPDVAHLSRNPVFLYLSDSFTNPTPFRGDVAVDVGDVMPVKWSMLDAMESQFYEWLPWLDGTLSAVPKSRKARLNWLKESWTPFFGAMTKLSGKGLEKWYGRARATRVAYAESFEICEYGHQPSKPELLRLFPFLPKKRSRT